MWILVLESSTTSAKAMVYDLETGEISEKTHPYPKMFEDGGLHDADVVFEETASLGRMLAEEACGEHFAEKIAAVALGGAWHGVMLCSKDMKPASPVCQWTYTGAAPVCSRLRKDKEFAHAYYHRTGCMVNATYPAFKLVHLREQGRDLENYYIMGQSTYNNYRLTGRRIVSRCMVTGAGLLNVHTKDYDEETLKLSGITKENFCQLVDSTETSPLTEEGAAVLGLKPGIPVVVGNSDGGLNQVGVGASKKGVMTFSVGTSGAMRLSVDRPTIPETPSTWCYLSPKGWLAGAATAGCTNCIDWFVDQVAGRARGVKIDYGMLEQGTHEKIEDTPTFLPFLFGERCPGWNDERQGGFYGILPHHELSDLYRSVQQGVLFNLYHCYRLLTDVAGSPDRIKLSGGILHSKAWTQMCADIFGHDMEIDESKQSSMMGAAVLAREVLGDLGDASDFEPHVREVVKPDMGRHELYMKQFEKYMKLYEMTGEEK